MGGCSCWPSNARPATTVPRAVPRLLQATSRQVAGWEVLTGILAVEAKCCDPNLGLESESNSSGNPSEIAESVEVELLHDGPDARCCLCFSAESPVVLGFLRVRLGDCHLGDVWHALVSTEERLVLEPRSEYVLLSPACRDDPSCEEVARYVLRAPWPLHDRDILQRRWQLPLLPGANLDGGERCGEDGLHGIAIVAQSFVDELLYPERGDRVRANVLKGGTLLRPLDPTAPASQAGVELTLCQQVDLGGLAPHWAQSFLSRYAVQSSLDWAMALREHCLTMRRRRQLELGKEVGDFWRDGQLLTAPKLSDSGPDILAQILQVERTCLAALSLEEPEIMGSSESVQVMLNEPDVKYFLCFSLGSPTVTGHLIADLSETHIDDVWSALTSYEERLARDPNSECQMLKTAECGDLLREEALYFVMRAPRPFWDRDVLQRRWQLPLAGGGCGDGVAIVMKSFEDAALAPQREDKVRAQVLKAGYLLRPLPGRGVQVVACQQLDMGGLCPPWAQTFLTKLLVQRGVQWSQKLAAHCAERRQERLREGRLIGDAWKFS